MTWTCGKFDIDLASTRVMGIVNVTPDSFSDGGLYLRPGDAVSHARALVRDGADVIDVGAESTRPGHRPLPAAVEWARLEPVLRQLLRELPDVPVSVDTYHAETARRAVDAGAAAINCVYTPEANMWSLVEETGCGFVVPAKDYRPIGAQVLQDPMVGFGTTREEDVALLGSLRRLAARERSARAGESSRCTASAWRDGGAGLRLDMERHERPRGTRERRILSIVRACAYGR